MGPFPFDVLRVAAHALAALDGIEPDTTAVWVPSGALIVGLLDFRRQLFDQRGLQHHDRAEIKIVSNAAELIVDKRMRQPRVVLEGAEVAVEESRAAAERELSESLDGEGPELDGRIMKDQQHQRRLRRGRDLRHALAAGDRFDVNGFRAGWSAIAAARQDAGLGNPAATQQLPRGTIGGAVSGMGDKRGNRVQNALPISPISLPRGLS